jgi:hypothetical protein
MGGIKRRVLILRAVSFERYFLHYRGKKVAPQLFCLGPCNPSVRGARSRPRRLTYSVLAFQRRNFTSEPNQPLNLDGPWFPRSRIGGHLQEGPPPEPLRVSRSTSVELGCVVA